MISRFSALLAAIICFQIVAPVCLAEDPAGKVSANVVYASPAEVFGAYRQALARRKWQTAFFCLTPQSRMLAILEVFTNCQLHQDARIDALLKKHNVTPADVGADYDRRLQAKQAAPNTSPDAREANAGPDLDLFSQILDERVANKVDFFAGLNELTNGPDALKLGALERVEVKQDQATGQAAVAIVHIEQVTANGPQVRKNTWHVETFRFRKEQGSWLIETRR